MSIFGPSLNTASAAPPAASTVAPPASDGNDTPVVATDAEVEDSRTSSSTNSPAPPDNEESDFFLGGNDSESSIGVPNIEDMRVDEADDSCLSGVASIPNEILISIFAKLGNTNDLFHCMLVSKRWAKNAVDLLWHRPACTSWKNHAAISRTLSSSTPFFAYRDFIKRLNLAASGLADKINDGSVQALASCTRVERLTLTNCKNLTDAGLVPLVENSTSLLALDVSGDEHITETSILKIAEHCKRLQGLNISGCRGISNDSMITLAQSCRYIKRLKLNECQQLQDNAIVAFAEHCPNILEIDLHQCGQIQNGPITALISKGQALRELRLAGCDLIDDFAFTSLPMNKTYDHLRILDLTSCTRLTDAAVQKIIDAAPRLRNLVLAKCRNITDTSVYAISKLGKNLHYLHLGHCGQITDDAVKRLVAQCNRIRYIDLGCCTLLTDASVTRLATLPKLKRIGLVKCSSITDESVFALARSNHRWRARRDSRGNIISHDYHGSSLERVHLSYCTNLTLKCIIRLLNACPRLTHLSLTGVTAFLREEFAEFCRPPPPEFTEHQRGVFCVFSGSGVAYLREHLNNSPEYESLRDWSGTRGQAATGRNQVLANNSAENGTTAGNDIDGPEGTEEDDAFEGIDGGEMTLDQPAPQAAQHLFNPNAQAGMPPPPPMPNIPPHLMQSGLVSSHATQGVLPTPTPGNWQHTVTLPSGLQYQPAAGSASYATGLSHQQQGANDGSSRPTVNGQSTNGVGASTATMSGRHQPQAQDPADPSQSAES